MLGSLQNGLLIDSGGPWDFSTGRECRCHSSSLRAHRPLFDRLEFRPIAHVEAMAAMCEHMGFQGETSGAIFLNQVSDYGKKRLGRRSLPEGKRAVHPWG